MHPKPIAALVLLALAGCQSSAPTRTAAPPVAGPAPVATAADDNLNAVLWVQTSVEYDALSTQTYRAAAAQLDRALEDPDWHALIPEERGVAKTLPPAVVLDIDETVLDNSPYQARLVEQGTEYDEVTWDAWVREQKAQPVPGVLEFARAAQARGVTLIYISNRAVHLKDATLANLRAVGLPVKDDSVFLGLGTHVEGCEQEGSEKHCRRLLAGQQYRVLMQFGDQLGDFVQITANTPQGRDALYAGYRDWFGQRWWMLANPTYGSWEPALFGNDFRQPREARRKAKREALEQAP
jgi:5'-nucleotidase (lipoprotein e(P4) family)